MNKYLITSTLTSNRHSHIKNHVINELRFDTIIPVFAPDWRLINAESDHRKKHTSLTMAYVQIINSHLFYSAGFFADNPFMIMEDDCYISPSSIPKIEKAMSELPKDFDLLYLSRTEVNAGAKVEHYSESLDKVISNYWETPITIWSPRFARMFALHAELKFRSGNIGNIDHELSKLNEGMNDLVKKDVKFFCVKEKMLAYGTSTVGRLFDTSM